MSTISSMLSTSNECFDVFLEPFKQGVYNLRDAINGKRVEVIAASAMAASTTREIPLSLENRAAAVAIGALLLVPIVNAVVLMILKSTQSNHYYAPATQPIIQGSIVRTLGGQATQVPQNPVTTTPSPVIISSPIIIPPVVVPVVPLTPEEMAQRKTEAVVRLGQLEAMGAGITGQFEANPLTLTFDLDAILQGFPATHNPSRLCDFLDWAAIDNAKQNQFRQAVEQFDGVGAGQEQRTVVKDLLSRLNSYVVQRWRAVVVGSAEETALKAQYAATVDKIIDANRNCIDQMLSQVQEIMLDVAGDMVIGTSGANAFASLQVRAGHALCNYRTNLVKEICVRQNPGEAHMADLERLVMQRLAGVLGIQGTIFNAGARFGGIITDVDAKVQNAAETFLNEYRPLEYLTTQIRANGIGPTQKLRVALNDWGVGHYAIADEDPDDAQPLTDMNPLLSADFDPDAFHDFENGGEWSVPGAFLILEATGLVRAR